MQDSFVNVGKEGKKVYMSPEDVDYVDKNPEGLTKEGVEESISHWKRSKNKYVLTKYEVMLVACKKLQPSGRTVEGGKIFARDVKTKEIKWAERIDRETRHLIDDLKPKHEEAKGES